MALDFKAIGRWVNSSSRVLDLGCGEGDLLMHLGKEKNIKALGVEIDPNNITRCIAKGVNVVEQDMDKGLGNFADNSFDTVLLTQTLQAVHRPDFVLREMLRVGKECIITFPNFGHWLPRAHLLFRGKMPVSKFMPYNWYDTPNIHFCTVKDFEALCESENIKILNRSFQRRQNGSHRSMLANALPNLMATHAYYHVTR